MSKVLQNHVPPTPLNVVKEQMFDVWNLLYEMLVLIEDKMKDVGLPSLWKGLF